METSRAMTFPVAGRRDGAGAVSQKRAMAV